MNRRPREGGDPDSAAAVMRTAPVISTYNLHQGQELWVPPARGRLCKYDDRFRFNSWLDALLHHHRHIRISLIDSRKNLVRAARSVAMLCTERTLKFLEQLRIHVIRLKSKRFRSAQFDQHSII